MSPENGAWEGAVFFVDFVSAKWVREIFYRQERGDRKEEICGFVVLCGFLLKQGMLNRRVPQSFLQSFWWVRNFYIRTFYCEERKEPFSGCD